MSRCKRCNEEMELRPWSAVGEPAECCRACDGIDPEAEREPYVSRIAAERFESDVRRRMDRRRYADQVEAEARRRLAAEEKE